MPPLNDCVDGPDGGADGALQRGVNEGTTEGWRGIHGCCVGRPKEYEASEEGPDESRS